MHMQRRAVLTTGLAATGLSLAQAGRARAQSTAAPIRIGILGDMSGPFAASDGPGCVAAAKLAVEDMGKLLPGRPIELLTADHQNKPDLASGIARQWFDRDNVAVIADLGNSAIALAVSVVAQEKNRAALVTASGPLDLTGKSCTETAIVWTFDTWSLVNTVARTVIGRGGTSWFILAVDYVLGKSLTELATQRVSELGGKVVGSVRHPLGTSDFSSYLVQAQASGAKVLALANGGQDTANCIKQTREFGLAKAGMTIVPLIVTIPDIHDIGLDTAQGLLLGSPFYWNLNDGTRRWSERFTPVYGGGREPTMMNAGTYSALMHWAKAVAAGADAQDGKAVVAAMKAMPTDDALFGRGSIRQDGRKLHDMHLFQVKSPAEATQPWDCYTLLADIPASEAFRPMQPGLCPLVSHV
jgi:branched-chain amino acid transport system substrate-binding protein